ncbi:SUKH-4 family immunity protein [Streptomyces sp. cg28]|uniref:SUKH-4 family immunity protein n=1 Tax=Streptomyces sp. cg28 TaxID=3403457 RepID=UPI003B210BB8
MADTPQAVELVNVSDAGPLITSAEPERIAASIPHAVEREYGLRVRLVEAPETTGAPVPALPVVPGLAPRTVAQLAACAGALELNSAPLSVWQHVARAVLGSEVSVATLRALGEAWSGVVVVEDSEDSAEEAVLRFADRALHRAVRAAFPLSAADRQAVAHALSEFHVRHAGTTYTTRALPTHAALAGNLEAVLNAPALLASVHWYGLWSALATAYPHGVPAGGTAADVHYLHAQGVRPGSQGEWVASLHHAVLSRGDTERADALAEAAGSLPWRTVWSHWRLPGGTLVPYPATVGVELLRADEEGGRRLAAEWREIAPAPGVADGTHCVYERRRWDARTGLPVDGPVRVTSDWPKPSAGHPFPEVTYALNHRGRWRKPSGGAAADVPRMPEAVREAVRVGRDDTGADLWAFAGYGGHFGVLVDPKAVAELPREAWRDLFLPGPLTTTAAWPFPADIPRTDDEVTRDRLERADAFRPGACRVLEPAALPDRVTHEPARRFLSETGWPCTRVIGGLYTRDLRQHPLTSVPDHPGLFEGLGQLASWTLYLNGESGAVHIDEEGEDGEFLPIASSMPRLLALALLGHLVLSTPLTSTEAEMEALSEAVPSWFAAADPDGPRSPVWEGVFDDLGYAAEDYATLLDELDAS